MLNYERYINRLREQLQLFFGDRLVYVGLQGSCLRGEATENSDIDVMVVLNHLSVPDLDTYRQILRNMGNYEKSCGFICGKQDLANWNPLEICNLLHCTKDYFGTLADLVPEYTRDDIRNFAKLSLNNLYHEICHRYIHGSKEKNFTKLPGSYKNVFFILQTVVFLRTGVFVSTKEEMRKTVTGRDREVMEISMSGEDFPPFDTAFSALVLWCQETLASLA